MADTEEVYNPGEFLSYRNDVMATLKFDWPNLKILISG